MNRADCLRCRVVRETGRRVRRRLDRRARGATRTWPRIWVYWRSGSRPLPTGLGPAADALPPLPIAELCRGAGARVMRSRRRRGVFPSRSASNAEIFSSTIRAGRPSVTRENYLFAFVFPQNEEAFRISSASVTERNLVCAATIVVIRHSLRTRGVVHLAKRASSIMYYVHYS